MGFGEKKRSLADLLSEKASSKAVEVEEVDEDESDSDVMELAEKAVNGDAAALLECIRQVSRES